MLLDCWFCHMMTVYLAGVIEMRKKVVKKEWNSFELFKIVFIVVIILTGISLVISTIVATFCPNPSTLQISLFETCSTTWKMGFGTIMGMIGGKISTTNST